MSQPRDARPPWRSAGHQVCLCRYDDILENGLPDWRQPVFYYRRVRKMSNAELGFLLFLILTVGHYAVIWSIYLEKQLVRQPIRAEQRSDSQSEQSMSCDFSRMSCSVGKKRRRRRS